MNSGTLLHLAAHDGDAAKIKDLLAGGADPVAQAKNGSTPLHSAAGNGHAAAIAVLLDGGADSTAL